MRYGSDERAFNRAVVRELRKRGWHVQPIEDKMAVGVPDINACCQHQEVWIELKVFSLPKRDTTHVRFGLRKEQENWALLRSNVGGSWFLMAREKMSGGIYVLDFTEYLYFYDSATASKKFLPPPKATIKDAIEHIEKKMGILFDEF